MAAINFPDAPTNGQIFESGGMSWTYVAGIGWTLNSAIVEAGSGFTFIADTMPLPVNVGDTWFDSSTGASGGTSWVAIEEGPAGASEKVWVQFAPGAALAAAFDPLAKGYLGQVPYSSVSVTDVNYVSLGVASIPFVTNRWYSFVIVSGATYITGGVQGSTFSLTAFIDGGNYQTVLVVDTALSGGYIPQQSYQILYKSTITKTAPLELKMKRDSASAGSCMARYSMQVFDQGASV